MMAALFDVKIPTINEHLKNIYEGAEPTRKATIRKFRIVRTEGNRDVARNLELIIRTDGDLDKAKTLIAQSYDKM
ncbi:hypothetical protein [Methanoregula sp.]|jgi:hypothetical protein|uniref:hypothetical protein n=1 Tax=Methanoregula sp. TaxID=2052170 RepID=UPI0025DC9A58|nr:hypothetical protein [Methanoregula sp.]